MRPRALLYICSRNRVRSPMAAGLTHRLYGDGISVESCGLEPDGDADPMAAVVMQEVGVDIFGHKPKAFAEIPPENFDLIVALSADAWAEAQAAAAQGGPPAEYWPIDDPTIEDGSRDMRLEAYRQTRRRLEALITERLGPPPEWD